MHKVNIKLHDEFVELPKKAHKSDAGLDLIAYSYEKKNKDVFFFNTGISLQPPQGYYFEFFCRSSIYKTSFMMPNHVGIIDPGYTGIIYMVLKYLGHDNADIAAQALIGEKIGQIILKKQELYSLEIVHEHLQTERGHLGFGSSDRN